MIFFYPNSLLKVNLFIQIEIGLSNSRKALTRLDADEKAEVTLSDGRQNRNYATS